ncbi:ABC transporter ATP-binding protein [Pseudonocardia sp.]|uniref:ABC transporter ATP-binding protein n=1 Tax=Pseudonocardia sp. TaxID=60912 RepID=UPI003D14F41A
MLALDDVWTRLPTAAGPLSAVRGVSLDLYSNETVGLVGESGSGKSMLGRTILNILPDGARVSGSIRYQGKDVRADPRAANGWRGVEIAMIFQNPMTSLNPVRTIGKQIIDPIRHHLGLAQREAADRAMDLLNQVGVSAARQRLGQYPHELSGGMRQRVAIAIALSCDPKVLIADEPTTALDVTVQKQVLDPMESLQERFRMAILLITHDLGVVAGRADRVAVMYAGEIVEMAQTADLFAQMQHPYTRALLDSVPRLDDPPHVRRPSLAGRPPNLALPLVGCPFQPRCANQQPDCAVEVPALVSVPECSRSFSCHHPVGVHGTVVGGEGRAGHAAAE